MVMKVDEETEELKTFCSVLEVTAPKELKTFRSVLEVTAPKGFVVKVLYDGTLYTWKQDTPFTPLTVKHALWFNALQHFGDLHQVADVIVIHRWGFPIDEDLESFQEKVCLLKCTLRSSSGTAASSSAARRIALIENDKDEDEVAMMEAWCASTMDVHLCDGVEVELQFREDYEPGKTTYQIFVKTLPGKTITLDISILDDVDSVKAMIEAKTGIPADKQRLICGGRRLEDVGANIKKEITLHLMLSLLGGMGKRAQPGAGGEGGDREEKQTRIRALRAEILTNMVMTQGTRNIVSHNVRTRIMELERDFQQRKADEIFQHLYTNMTEQQMLALQEKYVGAGRNMNLRYAAVSKSIFEQQFQQIEDCRIELTNMAKMLNDTSNLAMYLQYCGNDGFLNWADFAKTLNKTVTEKSRAVGAVVGAAAAGAAPAGANNVGFRVEEEML